MKKTIKFKVVLLMGILCGLLAVCLIPGGCSSDEELPMESMKYYFDSSAADGGNGSESSPFNSLSEINELELVGGDRIYIKAGSKFIGSLALTDISGTDEASILITSYGDISKYGLPAIDGNGTEGRGVLYIENCSYITVENIELYDSCNTEGDRRGVLVNLTNPESDEVITYSGITLRNLYIHDIRGITDAQNSGMSVASKKTGGIHVWSDDGRGRTSELTISGCRIDNVDNVGIASWYKPGTGGSSKISPYRDDFDIYAHLDPHICDNEISHIGKNGIFARNIYGGVIERNTLYETATTCVSGNTIVTSFVYGTVVQFNEGYYNRASARPSDGVVQDGCMLDADLQSRDTVWQYNYSHDNAFGLFLNCTSYDPDKGIEDKVTVRYNLSVHDKGNKGIVYVNYETAGIDFYNNTFVVSAETSPIILQSNSRRKYSFYNNIIYNMSSAAKFAIKDTVNVKIGNNLVYNAGNAIINSSDSFLTKNVGGVNADPLFRQNYSDSASRNGREFAKIFKIQAGSPAFDAAKDMGFAGGDFFGNAYRNCIGFSCDK